MAESLAHDRAVAVVLVPKGSERVAVRAISSERSWRVVAISDPMMAMAELALADQAARTRASNSEPLRVENDDPSQSADKPPATRDSATTVSFVLAHPRQWATARPLLEAIRRYLPAVDVCTFDEQGLRELFSANGDAEAGREQQRRRARPGPRVEQRATEPQKADGRPPRASDPSITRDEIEMLLGGDSR